MTVWELDLPLGPSQLVAQGRSFQGGRRLGRRLCLLKDCERPYFPRHPLGRYCSSECRAAARRWRRCAANRRYRASERGKGRRQAQCRRYRIRQRQEAGDAAQGGCEGYPHPQGAEESCCRRPGCYEVFVKTARSPLQKFCSSLCRQALRRVLLRERRWRRILGISETSSWRADDSW